MYCNTVLDIQSKPFHAFSWKRRIFLLPGGRLPSATRPRHQESPSYRLCWFSRFPCKGEEAPRRATPRRAKAVFHPTLLRTVSVPVLVPRLRLPAGAGTRAGLAARLRASSGEVTLQLSAYRYGILALSLLTQGRRLWKKHGRGSTRCTVHCRVPDTWRQMSFR